MNVSFNFENSFLEVLEEHDTTQVGSNPDALAFLLSDLELDKTFSFCLSSFSAINGNNTGLSHPL